MTNMNRIGVRMLTLLLFVAVSVSCQNFFWSHRGVTEEPIVDCVEYGYLYNWYAATDTRNIAAEGWRLPTMVEFINFSKYLDPTFDPDTPPYPKGSSIVGGYLKEVGFKHWDAPNTGATNLYGYNSRGGGFRDISGFGYLKRRSLYWIYDLSYDLVSSLYYDKEQFDVSYVFSAAGKLQGNSIRLISDATGIPDGTTTVYVGNDGKAYPAVAINGLYWLAANLAETEYRNGDPIPTVEDATTWAGLTTGAKCAYENNYEYVGCDETYDELTTYPTIEYGLLYNWYAVNGDTDGDGVSNTSITSSDDWFFLTIGMVGDFAGHVGYTYLGGRMKDTDPTYWEEISANSDNSLGLNFRGTGRRLGDGEFFDIKRSCYIFINRSTNRGVGVWYNSDDFSTATIVLDGDRVGAPIRLVAYATGVPDGTTTTYTGNDGKVYLAVAINGLYWLAENLAETKYRNGDIIPEVTDDTAWRNLRTGALCAYENDWNYVGRTKPDYYE